MIISLFFHHTPQGLGKKFYKDRNQHHITENKNSLYPEEKKEQCFATTNRLAFSKPSQYTNYSPSQQNSHYHRYSRAVRPDGNRTTTTSTTTANYWGPDNGENGDQKWRTSTQVLAVSQGVQKNSNKWRFSYKSTIFPFIATRPGCERKNKVNTTISK